MSDVSTSDSLVAIQQLKSTISEQIIGQDGLVERMLIALLADGHILVEGAPGLAKTRAINALSKGIQADFHRVQFTPDLLPADLTGTEIYRPEQGSFEFQKGPLFHNLVLADEINRSPAKVQAALLEAMAERQVSVGKETFSLDRLFLVMATQNPIEQEGTYPLPEAQLDRFLMHVRIGYPDIESEQTILRLARKEQSQSPDHKEELMELSQETIFEARKEISQIHMSEAVENYIVHLTMATRQPKKYGDDLERWIGYGASPRATIALDRCSRAYAWLQQKDFVSPDDVRAVLHDVYRHRILITFEAEAEGITTDHVINELIHRVPAA